MILWAMMLDYNRVWLVGTNIPEPEAPPMNGNGAAMPGEPPTVPGGVEGQS